MKPLQQLVWVDLETTGLDPEKDQILEVAIVVTSAYGLQPILKRSWVVKPANGLPALHPAVLDMHSKSGLLAQLHNAPSIAHVDELAAASIPPEWRGGPICGSTAHFDLAFIRRHMPLFSKCFGYRVFDVSTLKQARCQAANAPSSDEGVEPAHRALDDIEYSISVARDILLNPWPAYKVGS